MGPSAESHARIQLEDDVARLLFILLPGGNNDQMLAHLNRFIILFPVVFPVFFQKAAAADLQPAHTALGIVGFQRAHHRRHCRQRLSALDVFRQIDDHPGLGVL